MRKTKGVILKLIAAQKRINRKLYDEFQAFSVECDHRGMVENGYVSKCFCPNNGISFNHGHRCWLDRCPLFYDQQMKGKGMSDFRW